MISERVKRESLCRRRCRRAARGAWAMASSCSGQTRASHENASDFLFSSTRDSKDKRRSFRRCLVWKSSHAGDGEDCA